MKYSRRDLGVLLPVLVAAAASAPAHLEAQQAAPAGGPEGVEKLPVMKTQRFAYDDLPVATNGKNKQRRMFTAKTHTGFKIESHMSDIAPGEVNHPPHQHLREEMMLIREGIMELTIAGKPYRLGPGESASSAPTSFTTRKTWARCSRATSLSILEETMSNERFQGFHGFQRFLRFALAIACFAGASAQESLTAIRAGRMFDARTGAMLANQIILIRVGESPTSDRTSVRPL